MIPTKFFTLVVHTPLSRKHLLVTRWGAVRPGNKKPQYEGPLLVVQILATKKWELTEIQGEQPVGFKATHSQPVS